MPARAAESLPGLSEDLLETYRQQGAGMASPMSQLVIVQLGGALADHDATTTSFGNRDADSFFRLRRMLAPRDAGP